MVKITFDNTATTPPLPVEALNFTVTPAAAQRLTSIFANKKPGSYLRIAVHGGGCNGYSYSFKLDTSPPTQQDYPFTNTTHPKAKVILNETSLRLLNECTLDFTETAEASQFTIHNPHAKSSCGCGNSFGY